MWTKCFGVKNNHQPHEDDGVGVEEEGEADPECGGSDGVAGGLAEPNEGADDDGVEGHQVEEEARPAVVGREPVEQRPPGLGLVPLEPDDPSVEGEGRRLHRSGQEDEDGLLVASHRARLSL